jgi:hypothetical protein
MLFQVHCIVNQLPGLILLGTNLLKVDLTDLLVCFETIVQPNC